MLVAATAVHTMTAIVIIGKNMSAATLVVTNMRVKKVSGFKFCQKFSKINLKNF